MKIRTSIFLQVSLIILTFLSCINLYANNPFNGLELSFSQKSHNNIPYVMTNESYQEELLEELLYIPQCQNGVHIGWSIEMNYKIILNRKSKLAILCDINTNALLFLDTFKSLILSSDSVNELLDKLQIELSDKNNKFSNSSNVQKIIDSYTSWLYPEENFQYLKEMYSQNRILHSLLNVLDETNQFSNIAEWINANGYSIDTIYTSNISEWVRNAPLFSDNMLKILGENTVFIDAIHHFPGKKNIALRLSVGTLPQFNRDKNK